MKKYIILAGSSRAGKTTIALELVKRGYNYYSVDSIKRGIYNSFIKDREEDWKKISPNLSLIIKQIILDMPTSGTNDLPLVFDSCHLNPIDAYNNLRMEDVAIIFLAYPNISVEEVVSKIRANDKDTYWTKQLSDEKLKEITKRNIEYSKYITEECERLNLVCFDVSNREEGIQKVLKYITDK